MMYRKLIRSISRGNHKARILHKVRKKIIDLNEDEDTLGVEILFDTVYFMGSPCSDSRPHLLDLLEQAYMFII